MNRAGMAAGPMDDAHGLIVGIARYRNVGHLPDTVLDDARDIHAVLTSPDLGAYPPGNVTLLRDDQATLKGIRDALAGLAAQTTDRSTVFVFMSSHGARIETGPNAGEYLLPVDVVAASEATLAATAMSGAEFTEALRAIRARKAVVMFDCCHAGGIGQAKDVGGPALGPLPESYYETLARGVGRVIVASSRSTEQSWVMPGQPNSLFTGHLLGALRGGAPGPGGVVRIFDIFRYVQPRVTQDQPAQHPIFKAEIEDDFPVALYLGGKAAQVVVTPGASPVEGPSGAEQPVRPADDGFAYDVFLSYRDEEPQRTWVRRMLRPRLEAAGLRVIDQRDYRLGEAIVLEMERAVIHSRYTLAVLTAGYLENSFTELDGVLAEHLGLELKERRLLVVMRERTTPRLGMRARMWLDMTYDDEFEVDVKRLTYELSLSSDRTLGST